MINASSLFEVVKSDFSALWKCRPYGDTVELVSPYMSSRGDLISVFVTCREDRYIITDGAGVFSAARALDLDLESRKGLHFRDMLGLYRMKTDSCSDLNKIYCFKSTTSLNCVSSCVFDVLHFQEAILNAINLATMFDVCDDDENKKFSTKVKEVLKDKIFKIPAKDRRYDLYQDDHISVTYRFNATLVDRKTDSLWLGMCVYSSNYQNFSGAVCRAECGFHHVLLDNAWDRDRLNLAVVTDEMPTELSVDRRVLPLRAFMGTWDDLFGVDSYSYDELMKAEISSLWKKVG